MANKLKAQNKQLRVEIASKIAKGLRRQNPRWTLQQVNDAAFKAADLQIKQGVPNPAGQPQAVVGPEYAQNRDAIAGRWAKVLAKQNPSWTPQRVNNAAYRVADAQIRRDEP